MSDKPHGSACLLAEPVGTTDRVESLSQRELLPYRGCTKALPHRGVARTAPTWILRAAGHRHEVASAIHLDLGELPWAGVACWKGAAHWVTFVVPTAYALRYDSDVRPAMPGNPISLKTLVRVAEARAHHADYRTGRNCRPSNQTLAAAAGVSVRTAQRASTALRLLGVATEVLRGRQRSRDERFASWRVGDRGRGWASVWALHESRIHYPLSPHLRSGHLTKKPSSLDLLTTKNRSKRRGNKPATRVLEQHPAWNLARQWVTNPSSPPWTRQYRSLAPWARVLKKAAEHGWTARDINQLLSDYVSTGHWIAERPHKPAGLLGYLLGWHGNLEERPSALDEARDAQELAAIRVRQAENAIELQRNLRAREEGRAALSGPGHSAARRALDEALRRKREIRPHNHEGGPR